MASPGPTPLGRTARTVLAALAGVVAVAAAAAPAAALAPPTGPEPSAYVLVDLDRGVVLEARDAHTPRDPASMVKVLTALTAVERLRPGTPVPVSARAAAEPPMRIGMPAGEAWPREQMLDALLMVSANDVAWALAECAGGDVAGFAAQGNSLMRRLGATDGRFGDPAGLSDRSAYDGGSRLSPWDLAVLGRNALAVPAIARPAGTVETRFTDVAGRPHRFVNHNSTLLRGYPGANGLKTGFTDNAGRTLVASARRDDRSMLAVVFGTWDTAGWAGALLDRGFASPTDAPGLATLPPVRVRPARADGPATCGASVTGGSAGTATADGSTSDGAAVPRDAAPARPAARPFSARIPWGTVAIGAGAVVAVLTAVVLARRAVVLRRRRRRAARRRAVARAHRSGTIHVVDAVPPRPNADHRRTSRATRTGPGVTARSTRGDR